MKKEWLEILSPVQAQTVRVVSAHLAKSPESSTRAVLKKARLNPANYYRALAKIRAKFGKKALPYAGHRRGVQVPIKKSKGKALAVPLDVAFMPPGTSLSSGDNIVVIVGKADIVLQKLIGGIING